MEEEYITFPVSKEEVERINLFQKSKEFHPLTCCSPEDVEDCQRMKRENEGILTATENYLICPCGKYTQTWMNSLPKIRK